MPLAKGAWLVACDPDHNRLAVYQNNTLLLAWDIDSVPS
jgi:hypothetical protein